MGQSHIYQGKATFRFETSEGTREAVDVALTVTLDLEAIMAHLAHAAFNKSGTATALNGAIKAKAVQADAERVKRLDREQRDLRDKRAEQRAVEAEREHAALPSCDRWYCAAHGKGIVI